MVDVDLVVDVSARRNVRSWRYVGAGRNVTARRSNGLLCVGIGLRIENLHAWLLRGSSIRCELEFSRGWRGLLARFGLEAVRIRVVLQREFLQIGRNVAQISRFVALVVGAGIVALVSRGILSENVVFVCELVGAVGECTVRRIVETECECAGSECIESTGGGGGECVGEC